MTVGCSDCATSPFVPPGWFIAPNYSEYPGLTDAWMHRSDAKRGEPAVPVVQCACNPLGVRPCSVSPLCQGKWESCR